MRKKKGEKKRHQSATAGAHLCRHALDDVNHNDGSVAQAHRRGHLRMKDRIGEGMCEVRGAPLKRGERRTSPEKSTWPGESIRFTRQGCSSRWVG